MFRIIKLSTFLFILFLVTQANAQISVDNWSYIQIDSTRQKWGDWEKPYWLKSFGIDASDITNDGFKDIVAGRYFYRNPGGDMSEKWERTDFGLNVDGMLIVDVDGDKYGDVIAEALPNVYWLEAQDMLGRSWKANKIAELPPTKHINSQGYKAAQIIPGGKPELVFTTLKGAYYIIIPKENLRAPWETVRVTDNNIMDEGVGIGDINQDGTLDIVVGKELKKDEDFSINWFSNPGDGSGNWKNTLISKDVQVPDRIVIADVNGDNLLDVVISEERFPSKEPDANLSWYKNPGDGSENWERHTVFTGYTMNSMDVGDIDNDGDMDIVTSELIKSKKLLLFKNDGEGQFKKVLIDTSKEMHLGARLFDLDDDGDLDIIGTGWRDYKYLHLWRNDALQNPKSVKWAHISTQTNLRKFPTANVGWQASSIVFDIDKNGSDDIVIAGWSDPSMVWLQKTEKGWKRFVIDDKHSHIEAGGAYCDIDGDGDLDILQGSSWNNEVWWWENPYPNFDTEVPWERYTIKNTGAKQHHDQIFGDFNGNGKTDLIFWNQKAKKIWISEIPEDPKKMENWKLNELWSWEKKFKYEGLAKADVDQDGIEDLIGGGYWFKYESGTKYIPNMIDDYGQSRSAVGDLIKGGSPEIVLGSGDGIGPLNLYEWNGETWKKTTLIDTVDHGHTLQVGDINGDGNLDIYTAEMRNPGAGDNCKQYILYGDGKGKFTIQIVSIGIGTHEGKLGDVDGDGDLDIMQKDFKSQKRVDVWFNEGVE